MKYRNFLAILLLVSSCGGGGGGAPAIPFALSIGLTIFSINEDTTYTGSLSATANEVVTLSYAITTEPVHGVLTLNSASGDISYRPQEDFNGTDEFKYSVTAAGKSVTQNATVAITVNAVDDAPTFNFETPTALSKADMLFESNQTFRVQVSDKDSSLDELTYDLLVEGQSLPGVFTLDSGENPNGIGTLAVDISSISKAGLYTASIRAYDGTSRGISTFETWFVSNKTTVTIDQDDDPEDGLSLIHI